MKSKCEIDKKESYLLIHDFNEFFHGIFLSHVPLIATFLNNIRWEIYLYLENEFKRSIKLYPKNLPTSLERYRYHVSPEINDSIAQAMYLILMKKVGFGPFMSPNQIIEW